MLPIMDLREGIGCQIELHESTAFKCTHIRAAKTSRNDTDYHITVGFESGKITFFKCEFTSGV